MRNNWIFKHSSDLKILRKKIDMVGSVRGYRSQLAQAAGCQPAYLSQVLSGSAYLTMEQSEALCRFWSFDERESDYFLILTQMNRAGTLSLRKRLNKKLSEIREQHQEKSRTEMQVDNQRVQQENALQYYLNWAPTAIHMYCRLAKENAISAIANDLKVSDLEVARSLELLQEMGLVKKRGQGFQVSSDHVHIPNDNHFSSLHHRNWREKAMADYFRTNGARLHFTSLYTLDPKLQEQIRTKIRSLISEINQMVEPAPETKISCLNIDFFEV